MIKAIDNQDVFEMVELDRSVSIQKACDGVTIKQAAKQMGEKQVVRILLTQIVRTAGFFNVTKPMSEEQTIETAYLLLDSYPSETVEDFILMFSNAKKGKYGELYNRLDGQIIFQWMGQYLEEKAAHREKLHRAVKFSDQGLNVQEVVQSHRLSLQEPEINPIGKPVIEALKEAIGFEQLQEREKNYEEFKREFIQKKILEKQLTNSVSTKDNSEQIP